MNKAIQSGNPEIVLALIEELIQRSSLEVALANRSEKELEDLLKFVKWKIQDIKYQSVLI